MLENTIILVCLNSKGRASQAVGPFHDDDEARAFFNSTAAAAYHGFTLVDLVSPDQYSEAA